MAQCVEALPPAPMIELVSGSADARWFVTGGRLAAQSIRDALNTVGRPVETLEAVLDWGCGCGRVIRHFADMPKPRFFGCDYNAELIAWSKQAYRHAQFESCSLLPPLPFDDASFDLVYGLSVFTHLPAQIQAAWMVELARVIRRGGIMLLTMHGDHYLSELSPEEEGRFHAGDLVERSSEAAGSNMCATFGSWSYVQRTLADAHGFKIIYFEPEGARGNPAQDLYVLRRVPA